MNNFWKRTITGTLFVGIVTGAILWNSISFLILFGIISGMCLYEFYRLFRVGIFFQIAGLAGGLMIFLVSVLFQYFDGMYWPLNLVIVLLSPFIIISFTLFFKNGNSLNLISKVLFGWIYIIFPFVLLTRMVAFNNQNHSDYILVLAFMMTVWVNDTMAYMTGSLLGKHKLFERISPKKTWEGFFGGMLFSILFGFVNHYLFGQTVLINWVILSVIVSIFATIGDLIESQIKRSANVKDSGSFFPGHGGFLDRFDGVIFAIPFYFIYLILSGLILN